MSSNYTIKKYVSTVKTTNLCLESCSLERDALLHSTLGTALSTKQRLSPPFMGKENKATHKELKTLPMIPLWLLQDTNIKEGDKGRVQNIPSGAGRPARQMGAAYSNLNHEKGPLNEPYCEYTLSPIGQLSSQTSKSN